jgi:predicted nucleic acid-binding protein
MGDVRVSGARATTSAPEPPKAYLDNCIVGALAQGEPEEKTGIHGLIKLWHARQIGLVTSPVALEEIGRVPEEHRAPHEAVYALLEKVPTIDEDALFPPIVTGGPGIEGPIPLQHRDLGWLTSILRDEDDARHVYQAVGNECAYFVTTDERTILSRAEEIEGRLPIKLRKPSTPVLELTGP